MSSGVSAVILLLLVMDNNIFTVKVNKGIRVAICSMSAKACKGLAKRMKDILDTID